VPARHTPDTPPSRAVRRRTKVPTAPGDRELRLELKLSQEQLATLRARLGADHTARPWLTHSEAAAYLGVSYRHLSRLVAGGALAYTERPWADGRRGKRFHVNALDAYLAGKEKAS
jgi:excisionase family DNA binding protein